MKNLTTILGLLIVASQFCAFGQQSAASWVSTSDIDNFWIAYDSVTATTNETKQIEYIKKLYIDKGTEGLHAFMESRNYTPELWVKLINKYPKFWASVRTNTLQVKSRQDEINATIKKLKELYPALHEARMYFTIGGLRSGGTVKDNMVLIGCEIACGDATTDVSEFSDKWLERIFRTRHDADHFVALNVHEYVHTQQRHTNMSKAPTLLSKAIGEGSCDFITELVMGTELTNDYLVYGKANEQRLKEEFKKEMYGTGIGNWIFNAGSAKDVADLGYFIGYAICKSYYNNMRNKKQAIKDIIELDLSDDVQVEAFLKKSRFYKTQPDKKSLLAELNRSLPYVVSVEPIDASGKVNASVTELIIVFSHPMNTAGYSINLGHLGKDHFPIVDVKGFSEDKKSFIVKAKLNPGTQYDFIVTPQSFRSEEGHSLKEEFYVKFSTHQ